MLERWKFLKEIFGNFDGNFEHFPSDQISKTFPGFLSKFFSRTILKSSCRKFSTKLDIQVILEKEFLKIINKDS